MQKSPEKQNSLFYLEPERLAKESGYHRGFSSFFKKNKTGFFTWKIFNDSPYAVT